MELFECFSCVKGFHDVSQYCVLLSALLEVTSFEILPLIMLGFLENANIGEIQYLSYGDECWYICRSVTVTFRKCIILWSHDPICIYLHM